MFSRARPGWTVENRDGRAELNEFSPESSDQLGEAMPPMLVDSFNFLDF
jgi:hypothetical protein